ncbi:MOSC domain-containing protein [Tateyamaria sp. SN3-11]|uniref:MOSC domain-containing protein n=1 Tax=Tateyamaria sp. SN3-11 TaxID=3092147 RepID=UPI0039ED2EEC
MPALTPTSYTARITWLGRVQQDGGTLRSEPLERVEATLDGFPHEAHGGPTRPSCSRVRTQYPVGTEIRNVRQLTILSAEELAATAEAMGLETIAPEWVGASMIIEGIPDFTHVPPSSRLMSDSGVGIAIDMENRPCIFPGKEIEQEAAGFGKLYKPAAKGRRGVTAWIEHGGALTVGDTLTLHVPDQRVWAHRDAPYAVEAAE